MQILKLLNLEEVAERLDIDLDFLASSICNYGPEMAFNAIPDTKETWFEIAKALSGSICLDMQTRPTRIPYFDPERNFDFHKKTPEETEES